MSSRLSCYPRPDDISGNPIDLWMEDWITPYWALQQLYKLAPPFRIFCTSVEEAKHFEWLVGYENDFKRSRTSIEVWDASDRMEAKQIYQSEEYNCIG